MFLEIAIVVTTIGFPSTAWAQSGKMMTGGNLYMQTNRVKNEIICYKTEGGKLKENGRVSY